MACPTAGTAPIATTAIRATRSPYSTRSWPSSDRQNFPSTIGSSVATTVSGDINVLLMSNPMKELRARPGARSRPHVSSNGLRSRAAELAGDGGEDRADAGAGRSHCRDRDERDERDQQRVLEQILAFVVTRDRLHVIHELHDIPLRGCAPLGCGAMCGGAAVYVVARRFPRPSLPNRNGRAVGP